MMLEKWVPEAAALSYMQPTSNYSGQVNDYLHLPVHVLTRANYLVSDALKIDKAVN